MYLLSRYRSTYTSAWLPSIGECLARAYEAGSITRYLLTYCLSQCDHADGQAAIQFVNLLDLKQGFYSCISFMIYELTGEWRDGNQIASVIASRQHQPHDQSSASRHGFTVTPLPRNALSLTLINHAYRDKVLVMLMSKFVFDFACFDALNKFNKSVTSGWRDYIVLVRLQHIEGQSSYPFKSMKSLLLNAIPNLRVVQLSLQPRDPRRASFDD